MTHIPNPGRYHDHTKELPMSNPKEQIYDAKINPLMAQILAICKEAKINMHATFSLDDQGDGPLYCSSTLAHDQTDELGFKRVKELHRVANQRPAFAAFTIVTSKK